MWTRAWGYILLERNLNIYILRQNWREERKEHSHNKSIVLRRFPLIESQGSSCGLVRFECDELTGVSFSCWRTLIPNGMSPWQQEWRQNKHVTETQTVLTARWVPQQSVLIDVYGVGLPRSPKTTRWQAVTIVKNQNGICDIEKAFILRVCVSGSWYDWWP